MNLLYSALLHLVILWLKVRAFWHNKTARWLKSRNENNWQNFSDNDNRRKYWFHCASLGEYEQAHPLILKLKYESPDSDILLSFFSISGFENLPCNSPADFVFYLPFDLKSPIIEMVDHLQPAILILVKSEIWPNLIQILIKRNIPIYLISAKFDPKSLIFRIPFLRNALNSLTAIFTQDEETTEIARKNLTTEIITSGNTRIERVLDLKNSLPDDQKLIEFCQRGLLLVLGSVYPADMNIIAPWLKSGKSDEYQILLAPHEINPGNIQKIQEIIDSPSSLLSNEADAQSRILILDSIGQLSRVYRYAHAAYIGGGFGKGIHNILEPAVHSIPVCFGPKYEAFFEAVSFIANDTGFSINTSDDFFEFMKNCGDNDFLKGIKNKQETWFRRNASSTDIIMDYLRTHKLLSGND